MTYRLKLLNEPVSMAIARRTPTLRIAVQDQLHEVLEDESAAGTFALTVDGTHCTGWRCVVGDEVHVHLQGRRFVFGLPQTFWKVDATDKLGYEVHADMPGVLIAVHCEAGQLVQAGDKLVTIESMKLQVSLVASREGTVDKVHVAPEMSFERGALLVSFVRPPLAAATTDGKTAS